MTGEPPDAARATNDTNPPPTWRNRASAAPKEHDGQDDDTITQQALYPTDAATGGAGG